MRTPILFLSLLLSAGTVFADSDERMALERDPLGVRKSLKDTVFVVETDEESATESLNRISGEIDLGFAAPEDTYESGNQPKAGPFARQQISDRAAHPDRY